MDTKNKDILDTPDLLKDLVDQGLSLTRMDLLHDQLRLVGAVMGLRALLEVVTFGTNEPSKVAAARILTQLDEDPEVIAERLKSAPWADLTMPELEHMVDRLCGGETDITKLIEEAKYMHAPQEVTNGQETEGKPTS